MLKFAATLILLAALTACRSDHGPTKTENSPDALMKNRKITPADLKLGADAGTPVISSAQKFILAVPALGAAGERLVYPKDHPKAGQPILDFQGKPIGDRGVVFFNEKDQSLQAAAGDGQSVIIMNEVTREQADQLMEKLNSFKTDPEKLTLDQLKKTIDYARAILRIGDMYNSTREFVLTKMSLVEQGSDSKTTSQPVTGLKKRDDRDICQAIFIPGKFVFEGPAASPQVFEHGGVIVLQGSEYRGVQPEIFPRTYRHSDGRPIISIEKELKAWTAN
jgi:hypothetical protein